MKFTPHRLGAFLCLLLWASLVQAAEDKPSIRAVRFEPALWLFSGYEAPPTVDPRLQTVGMAP